MNNIFSIDKCGSDNINERILFLGQSATNLSTVVNELIVVDCSNLEIENNERFEVLIRNKESLEDLKKEIINLRKAPTQDKEEKLNMLYGCYSKIRSDITKKIDPLTIDLMISTDEIARNEAIVPYSRSSVLFFTNNKKRKK